MYFLLGISLVFAFLLTLNLLASMSASVLWRAIARPASTLSFRRQEQIIFTLRAAPVAAALVFVSVFLLPAYLLYEPAASGETVSLKLAVISLASLLGIGAAFFRVFRTLQATRILTRNWLKHSQLIAVAGVKIPVYRIQHPFPVIAVVGMLRPRMFVASQVFDSLTEGELRSAVAHEYGHLKAHDNFKRAFLRVCRDMLVLPLGRELDRAWADNNESAADEYAATTGGDSMALDLASTLVKIARIAPQNTSPVMPLGSFLIEEHAGDLKKRVQRLLQFPAKRTDGARTRLSWFRYSAWLYLALISSAVLFLATNKSLLLTIHDVSEHVVALLQ